MLVDDKAPGTKPPRAEVTRYIVNGVVATLVHYTVLSINLHVLAIPSAGIANGIAATFGIYASFLGSRYFVFRKREDPMMQQAVRFGILYSAIALLHGGVLYFWTDVFRYDYRIGFLIATGLQVVLSYSGNKKMVFR